MFNLSAHEIDSIRAKLLTLVVEGQLLGDQAQHALEAESHLGHLSDFMINQGYSSMGVDPATVADRLRAIAFTKHP